jgi:hypothetical protein
VAISCAARKALGWRRWWGVEYSSSDGVCVSRREPCRCLGQAFIAQEQDDFWDDDGAS